MKLKKRDIYILSFIFASVVIIILLSSFSFLNLRKLKGDISSFTPQSNYDLSSNNNIDPTKWVAVDNLGRTISVSGESYYNGVTNTNMTVGTNIDTSKQVGLFYHNWHNVVRHGTAKPLIIENGKTYIRNQGKDPIYYSSWEGTPYIGSLWWNEPVYGFYNPKDKYVIRKQIELFADAGVDFLVLDYTNYNEPGAQDPYTDVISNSVYPDELNVLFQALDEAKADGIKTPKVTFMLSHFACDPSNPLSSCNASDYADYNQRTKVMVQWLIENVYWNSSRQSNLLYGGGNLPIILAQHPSSSTWQLDSRYASFNAHWRFMGNQYQNAAYNTSGYDWSWIDKYPQTKYMYNTTTGKTNQIAVSPAQHTDKVPEHGPIPFSASDTHRGEFDMLARSTAMGSGYQYKFEYRNTLYDVKEGFQLVPGTGVGTLYGLNFQQQWDYAITNSPEFVIVTGWNEYLAGSLCEHFPRCHDYQDERVMFMDQYTDEYSRDLEPVNGSLKDSYYMQLVSNIRRYKGANGQASQPTSKTINIYGDPNQWRDSNLLDYNSYTNNTAPERNVNNNEWGYNNTNLLTNDGVKNDIRTTKVSYDASNIYFYVETVNNISDISKLRLFIDTLDSKTNTSTANWNEFEFALNRNGATSSTLKLEKVTTGCRNDANPSASNSNCVWTKVGDVNYQIVSNTIQVSIPRRFLGLTNASINFNYKWTDNNLGDVVKMYDIMSVYTDGDAAPGGRFAYKFMGNKAYADPTIYTVTYNANGGTGTVSPQTGEMNTKLTLRNNGYTNGTMTFKNWNTKADGTGTSYNQGDTIVISNNMTLYAIWDVTKVVKPTLEGSSSFVYNGSEQGITVNNVDTSKMDVSGHTTRTNAGNYQVTYTLKDKVGSSWSDGTTTDITFNWSITKVKLTKPSVQGDNTFTYNGAYHGLTFSDYDSNTMTINGNHETEVGSYTTTISLNDSTNYSWQDDTSSAQIYTWSITKANLNASVFMADYYEKATPSAPVVTGNLGNGNITFSYAAKGTDNYKSSAPNKKGQYTIKAVIEPTANFNGQTVTSNFEVLATEPEAIVLPDGSIVRDVGVYGALIDSYNREKGTEYDYTHLFTEAELASLETLSITPEEYHLVYVNSFSDFKYLTSIKTIIIDLWEGCNPNTLDLHSNLTLKNLTVKNTSIEVLNISKLNLTSIDLDKPNNISYLLIDKGHETTYIKNINQSNQYLITDPSTAATATGLLQTNYILNVANNGVYEQAYVISVLGDVRADGIIDIRDVAKAYSALSEGDYSAYTNAEKYALDINSDGKRNALDLIKIYDSME